MAIHALVNIKLITEHPMFTGVNVGSTNTIVFTKTIEFPLAPYAGLRLRVAGKSTPIINVEFDTGKGELSVITEPLEIPRDTDAEFAHDRLLENDWHSEQRIIGGP